MKRTLLNLFFIILSLSTTTGNAQSIIRTIAGNGNFDIGGFNNNNGPAATATLGGLYGVCTDTFGNVFFSDQYNNVVRRIDKNGIIKVVAGSGFPGFTGDGGPATAARLSNPQPVVCDKAGNLYIGDAANGEVRKVTRAGIITTIAGNHAVTTYSGDGGPATNAGLVSVSGLTFDTSGNLYIADANSHIRKVNTAGIISTFAGSGSLGFSGNGGPATAASMDGVVDMAFDRYGNMYVTEKGNVIIRRISPTGIISAFAGTPNTLGSTGDGGPATACRFKSPSCLAFDTAGNLFVTDQSTHRVRKITPGGAISLYAGSVAGFTGDGAAPSSATRFSVPTGICIDRKGNMFIVDAGSTFPGGNPWGRRIREVFRVDTFGITVAPSPVLCGNTFAAFTAHPTAAYYTYVYKWYRNGLPVGTNSATWSSPSINNMDTITCTIVDTANGGMLLAVSNPIVMTVLPPILPEVHVTTTGDTICNGLSITLTATAVNGGSAPVFTWFVNGVVRGTGAIFTYIPVTGDVVTCQVTSNDPCAFPNTAHVEIPLSVIPSFLPTVIVNASPDTVLSYWGQIITFFTNVTFGGTNPTYQWYNSSGIIEGATSSSYYQTMYAPDTVYCVMHSNAYCAVPEIDTSNYVHILPGTLAISGMPVMHSNLGVYPNPNTGQFTIKGLINTVIGADVGVEVRDVLGRSVFSRVVNGNDPDVKLPVSLGSAPPGMYYLIVSDANGRHSSAFIVK